MARPRTLGTGENLRLMQPKGLRHPLDCSQNTIPHGWNTGVGCLILQAEGTFDIHTVMAGTLVLTAFALAVDALMGPPRSQADEMATQSWRK